MAINYSISYVFAPNTTISSSQVNTNFSDNSNTWNGLEALTKTFAKLKVDVDPATALEVATKQYVDHYANYRRPNLQYSSGTVVNMEVGIEGNSATAQIQFPDGSTRSDATATRINCDLTRVAALSGSAQSGLRTGTVANNTWYSIYAVKVTDNSSNFVAVADTVVPTQGNFSTLNSNFGTNSWVYLGAIAYGDGSGTANAIMKFVQAGNLTTFYNTLSGGGIASPPGILYNSTASGTSIGASYAAGTSIASAQFPNQFTHGTWTCEVLASTKVDIEDAAGSFNVFTMTNLTSGQFVVRVSDIPLIAGIKIVASGTTKLDVVLSGYIDGVLGVGSNPIL